MKRSVIIGLLVLSALVLVPCRSFSKPLKVYIFAGQSNMVGKRSLVLELPAELQSAQKNLIYSRKGWRPLDPATVQKRGFGPEIVFAHEKSKELNEPIGIIKFSKGGTSLAEDWALDREESLYHKLLTLVRSAQQSREIEICGMFWMQGEADAKDAGMAENYAGNLQQFITKARADLMTPQMPFICGRINSPEYKFPYTAEVRKAQERCPINHYAWIDLDALPKVADNLHYNTAGIKMMGAGFYAQSRCIAQQSK